MKNKKGFTLVELMAVIIIIALVAILTFPNIVNQIKKTKKVNNDNINTIVIEAAKRYVADNPDDFDENEYCLAINTLVDNDYIKEDIVSMKDNDISQKYVLYRDNKYNVTENGYIQVEYIESTGTQYIDTGIVPQDDIGIFMDFVFHDQITTVSGTSTSLLGSSKNNGGFWGGIMISSWGSSDGGQFTFGNYEFKNPGLVINQRMWIKIENHKYTSSTGQNIMLNTLNSSFIHGSLYILSINTDKKVNCSNTTIYSIKMYEGDTLVRDFIPVLDKDGVACLYDLVEGKFYYNQGTGEFLYG